MGLGTRTSRPEARRIHLTARSRTMVPLSPQSLIISARTLALMGAQDDYTFGDAPPRSLHARASEHGSSCRGFGPMQGRFEATAHAERPRLVAGVQGPCSGGVVGRSGGGGSLRRD